MTAKILKHKFVSAIADGTDTTLVRPSNWNDEHDLWLGYRSVTGTTDTLAQTDHISLVSYNNAAAIAVSLPAPSGGNFGLGWKVKLRNLGGGVVTVSPASTVNGSSAPITLAQTESLEIYGTGTSDYAGVITRAQVTVTGVIRYDQSQALSQPQQAMALRNIGALQLNLINGKIIESRAAGAATFAIKTLGGSDPSATDPVGVMYQDGATQWLTAALSLTIPSTATLGTASARPFRLWFGIANNGGVAALFVRQCLTVSATPFNYALMGFDPIGIMKAASTTPPGNVSAINYSTSGVTIAANSPFRVVGFADYESGLATAGTWNAAPTRIMLSSPASPLPGYPIGYNGYSTQASTAITGTTVIWTNIQATYATSSPCNPIRVTAWSDTALSVADAAGAYLNFWVARAPVSTGTPITNISAGLAVGWSTESYNNFHIVSVDQLDATFTTAAQIYGLRANLSANNPGGYMPNSQGNVTITELMG
jgi:hypothetical protein